VKTMQEKALSLKLPEGLIPTNEEMQSLVEDVTALERVEGLRKRAYMFLEEKAETSSQAHHCVDSIVKRLDEDLIKLETQLKATGTFETSGGKPNDLAAIQVTPSVNEWILAKVISFNAGSGMYNLSDEDVESNKGGITTIPLCSIGDYVYRTVSILLCSTLSFSTIPRCLFL
jgi:hypothetical protein